MIELSKKIGQVPFAANVIFLVLKIYFLICDSYFRDILTCSTNQVCVLQPTKPY